MTLMRSLLTVKTTVSEPTGTHKATMQAIVNQSPPMQRQPIHTNRVLIVGYLVLIGCWLLPLMVQAQGNGQPEWWRAIENNDSNYIIGYGSGSTRQEAHSVAVKEIEKLFRVEVKSVIECSDYSREGSETRSRCTSTNSFKSELYPILLSDLEQIKVASVRMLVSDTNPNKRQRCKRNKRRGCKRDELATTYYIALGYDAADLIR